MKKITNYLIFGLILFGFNCLQAKQNESEDILQRKSIIREKIKHISKDTLIKYRSPKVETKEILELKIRSLQKFKSKMNIKDNEADIFQLNQKQNNINQAQSLTMPDNFYTPGEFDECQAVLISWPSDAFDSLGNYLSPFLPGWGYDYYTGELKPIYVYLLDTYTDSPFMILWAKLADAIQKEAQVWIRVNYPSDTTDLKNALSFFDVQLTNYRFFIDSSGQNAFWARDFGPFGIYVGDKDSLAFVDLGYYPSRPIDDDFSKFLGNQLGYNVYPGDVEIEGGNFMNDGYGKGFYSNIIYDNNEDGYGYAGELKKSWTNEQVDSCMQRMFNIDDFFIPNHLNCDGGTGHIDIYLKMMDEETIFTTEYPSVYNKSSFLDYTTANTNITNISKLNSTYNRPIRILKLPLPTSDNGSYTKTTCNTFNLDARGFINGLIINKSFIFPSYSNDTSGNVAGDQAAIDLMKKYLPGYNIVPIDARLLTPMGGAIHCITMQIPAENPIRIWHPAIRGYQELKKSFNILARIRNNSGIETAICKWRKAGEDNWNSIVLELNDTDYICDIPNNDFTQSDTIQYYLEVKSNNGKTMTKPITGPDGYYSFYFVPDTDVNDYQTIDNLPFALYQPYPNPANSDVNIKFSVNSPVSLSLGIYNTLGQQVQEIANGKYEAGVYSAYFNTGNLLPGVYYCRLESGVYSFVQSLIIIK